MHFRQCRVLKPSFSSCNGGSRPQCMILRWDTNTCFSELNFILPSKDTPRTSQHDGHSPYNNTSLCAYIMTANEISLIIFSQKCTWILLQILNILTTWMTTLEEQEHSAHKQFNNLKRSWQKRQTKKEPQKQTSFPSFPLRTTTSFPRVYSTSTLIGAE